MITQIRLESLFPRLTLLGIWTCGRTFYTQDKAPKQLLPAHSFPSRLHTMQHVGSSCSAGGRNEEQVLKQGCVPASCSTWTLSGATTLRLSESGLNHRLKVVVALARMKGPWRPEKPSSVRLCSETREFVAAKCSGYIAKFASYNYHGGSNGANLELHRRSKVRISRDRTDDKYWHFSSFLPQTTSLDRRGTTVRRAHWGRIMILIDLCTLAVEVVLP
jgi:hypothetical protein